MIIKSNREVENYLKLFYFIFNPFFAAKKLTQFIMIAINVVLV